MLKRQLSNNSLNLVANNELSATYAGYKLYYLLEKDLFSIFKTKSNRKKWIVLNISLVWIKMWLRIIKHKFHPKVNEKLRLINNSVIFCPTIENNLNSMLPLALELKNRKIKCVFIVSASSRNLWERYSEIKSSFPTICLSEIPSFWTKTADHVLSSWRNDIRLLSERLMDHKYSYLLRKYFLFYGLFKAEKFLALSEGFRNTIANSLPACIIAPRPKRFNPLTILMSAKLEGVPRIFVSHTTWFSKMRDMFDLYDLECFDAAIVYTEQCANEIHKRNSDIAVHVSGWPHSQVNAESIICHTSNIMNGLVVGYPAGRDYDYLNNISNALNNTGVKLLVKGHPPGGDREKLINAVKDYAFVQVHDHKEISLNSFLSNIHILICGKSNVGVEAASAGIPVISCYSDSEKNIEKYRIRSVESKDVSLWDVKSLAELNALILKLNKSTDKDIFHFSQRQKAKYALKIKRYDPVKAVDFIINNILQNKSIF
jgi:hypothetical protein